MKDSLDLVRDPVYGNINLDPLEAAVFASWPLQRLRGIRQLGLVELVFPGAVHSRLEHSLGTMHVAGLMARRLGLGTEDVQLVRMAGLLHDIGHPAFSHAVEQVLFRNPQWRPVLGGDPVSRHEDFTAWVISRKPFGPVALELAETRHPQFFDRVLEIIQGRSPPLGQIIAGDVDADRVDFLLRDSHHAGVSLGLVDLDQILDSLALDGSRVILGGEDDYRQDLSLTAAESMLVARAHHYNALIHNPRVQASRSMLLRSLERVLDSMILDDAKQSVFKFFTEYTDQDMTSFLIQQGDDQVRGTLMKLRRGDLPPLAARFDHRILPPGVRMALSTIARNGRMKRLLESALMRSEGVLVDLSVGSGVPRSIRTWKGFIYDESALAAGLTRSLTRQITLSLFSYEEISITLQEIETLAFKLLDFVRQEGYLSVDGLLLFFYSLHRLLSVTMEEKILVPRIRNITWIYRTVKGLKEGTEGKSLGAFLDYRFNQDLGFPYSEKLFEDLQILVAMGMIYQDLRHYEGRGRWAQRYEYMLTAEGLEYAKSIAKAYSGESEILLRFLSFGRHDIPYDMISLNLERYRGRRPRIGTSSESTT